MHKLIIKKIDSQSLVYFPKGTHFSPSLLNFEMCVGEFDGMRGLREEWERERKKEMRWERWMLAAKVYSTCLKKHRQANWGNLMFFTHSKKLGFICYTMFAWLRLITTSSFSFAVFFITKLFIVLCLIFYAFKMLIYFWNYCCVKLNQLSYF